MFPSIHYFLLSLLLYVKTSSLQSNSNKNLTQHNSRHKHIRSYKNRNVESTVTTNRSQLHILNKKLGYSVSYSEYKIKFRFNIIEYIILSFADIIMVVECILKSSLSVKYQLIPFKTQTLTICVFWFTKSTTSKPLILISLIKKGFPHMLGTV